MKPLHIWVRNASSRFLKTAVILAIASLGLKAQQSPFFRPVRFQVGMGLTFGGDTLAEAEMSDGSTKSIKAGGTVLFKLGVDYRATKWLSLQATLGRHMDSTSASNGSMDFNRNTLEGLVFIHPKDTFRVGLGLRKTSSAELNGSGAASNIGSWEFESSTGTILEVEWLSRPVRAGRGGVSLRYVNEKYTPTKLDGYSIHGASSVDGSHFGIGFSWYF